MSSRPRVPDKSSPPAKLRPSKSLQLHQHTNGTDPIGDADVTPKPLSATGRSRTTPDALTTLWTTTPQLSERESIFATTYLPSSSPPPSQPNLLPPPAVHDEPQEGDDSPVPAAAGRKVTLEAPPTPPVPIRHPISILKRPEHRRPEKQRPAVITGESGASRKQRSHPAEQSGEPMGQPTDPLPLPPGLSPLNSPFERPSTPLEKPYHVKFSENDVDEEERFRYRAWREGKASLDGKLLSGKPRNKGTRVDKKIQATLPKIDPPVTVARSRKASQYLGLFKEKDAAEELRRQQERAKEGSAEDLEAVKPGEPQDHAIDVADFEHGAERTPLISSVSQPDLYKHRKAGERPVTSPLPEKPSEELSPSRPSPSRKPTEADSTIGEELQLSHSVPAGDLELAGAEIAKWRDQKLKSMLPQLPADEEEESDREHISSALYFPHRQVIHESIREDHEAAVIGSDEEISPDQSKFPESQADADDQISRSPEEVEISLQSQDDNSCWHGDLRKDSSTTEEPDMYSSTNEATAPSSESDYDSQEESQSEYGYESSTNETIDPTSVSKQRRPSQAIRKHRHEYSAQNPVGAVQLKPYNHQVGGHSTVYRFSRRAVCKQLNNRENEFYETVERYHPELLEFLPRYENTIIFQATRLNQRSSLPRRTTSSICTVLLTCYCRTGILVS